MITAGTKLSSLSQIRRALKGGFAIRAELFFDEWTECVCFDGSYVPMDHYSGCCKPSLVREHMVGKMTDLPESAYLQLCGIASDEADQEWSWWKFVATTE